MGKFQDKTGSDALADCEAHSTPTCGNQAAVGDAAAATRLKAGTTTTDAACDACTTGTSAAAGTDNCVGKKKFVTFYTFISDL